MKLVRTRKLIIAAMMVSAMLAINVLPAYAGVVEITLPSTKWRVESASLEGNYAKISGGYVETKSKLPVWFVIESSKGGYHDVKQEKVSQGKSPTGILYRGEMAYYRLELNPYGTETTGCMAKGSLTVLTK